MLVKPFLKWAGGKTQLLPQISELLPIELKQGKIKKYVEPFLGGGALLIHLLQTDEHIEKFICGDVNHALILSWEAVKNYPDVLCGRLEEIENDYLSGSESDRSEFFQSVREQFNKETQVGHYDLIQRASKFIWLNRTCFNGLYRVNNNGNFNVPHGKYKSPVTNKKNILALSELLNQRKVEFLAKQYIITIQMADESTLTYFDPPYRPVSPTANFTGYTASKFNDNDQHILALHFTEMKGYRMLSNSYCEDNFFDTLFHKHSIYSLTSKRPINCQFEKRGAIKEIFVTSYNQ